MMRLTVLFCIGILLLAACSGDGGDEAAAVPTDTLVPLFSLTPRLTATPISTRTPIPTFTPIPSETPIPPTPSNTPTPTPKPPIIGIVQSLDSVNVREGPDVSYSAIRALVPGTGVELLNANPDGTWYNIRMEDGTEGWIFANLLFIEETPTPFPTFTLTPDETALALGTTLPTALIGGGTITPTPPNSVTTATPANAASVTAGPTQPFLPTIDLGAINQTATALAAGVISVISPPAPAATGDSPNSLPEATDAGSVSVITPTPTGSNEVSLPPTATPAGETQPTATTIPASSGQVEQGVDVFAMCNDRTFGAPPPTNLVAGSTIDVFWAWYVADPSYIDQHVEAVNYEVRINDTLLSNWREYGTRTIAVGDSYAKYWYVPYGPLQPGEYTITYRATWSQTITDGYENFGPGTSNLVEEGSCTFTVQ